MELSSIEILMLLFIGWQASTLYRHWKDDQTIKLIIKQVDAEEKRIDEKIIDEVKARLPICYIEKHDDSDYLLYNRDTEEFVCQGSSLEELAEKCKERFDSVLVKAHEGAYWFVDGKVKEITE
jgi:predicted RNase H-like HicB family nuclease